MGRVGKMYAAYMAGFLRGIFRDIDQLKDLGVGRKQFFPDPDADETNASYEAWREAVQRIL